ncbi:hypothetical protein EZV62_003127 [Acer yangbiense]|uniref:Auxin-responsive protein n=1 Tax=Acer yangbiense TaxID=1000413 RepID=A0A5C7IHJ6_9ROSI|nr:hypothetical protein EZV62_003127 [Acer yangbiense]
MIMGVRSSKLKKNINITPRGYVPICCGDETRRFMVHRKALAEADFLELLCKAAEEYDFCHDGVLRIPYEAKEFEEWMINYKKIAKTKGQIDII